MKTRELVKEVSKQIDGLSNTEIKLLIGSKYLGKSGKRVAEVVKFLYHVGNKKLASQLEDRVGFYKEELADAQGRVSWAKFVRRVSK